MRHEFQQKSQCRGPPNVEFKEEREEEKGCNQEGEVFSVFFVVSACSLCRLWQLRQIHMCKKTSLSGDILASLLGLRGG